MARRENVLAAYIEQLDAGAPAPLLHEQAPTQVMPAQSAVGLLERPEDNGMSIFGVAASARRNTSRRENVLAAYIEQLGAGEPAPLVREQPTDVITTEQPTSEKPVISSVDDLLADIFGDRSARSNIFIKQPNNATYESWKQSGKNVARNLGIAVLAMAGITVSLFSYAQATSHNSHTQATTETPQLSTGNTYNQSTTGRVTVKAPEVTAPVAPAPEQAPAFTPKPGDMIGVLVLPSAVCKDEVIVGEYSEKEDVDHIVGTGAGFIDKKIPDATPDVGCDARTEREKQHEASTRTDYIGRPDRVRNGVWTRQNTTGDASSVSPDNPSGRSNFFQPIAGHTTSVQGDGIYLSAIPGNNGNAVISGHGSTYNAAFGDVALLVPGDTGEFKRADGHNYQYEVIGTEVVSANQYDYINNYSNPNYSATITLSTCTGARNGDPGTGDQYRTIVRLGVKIVQ